jgi:hypothetical protein
MTVVSRGRRKAYRPMDVAARGAALEAGLAAYAGGDYFLAHELLEPAWMGTSELAERDLLQGLIKLAAAFVHGARGNAAGVRKNLRGARELLASAVATGETGARFGLNAAELVREVDARLAGLVAADDEAIVIRRGAPPG